ncbi:glycosyltransferase family 4 protein [Marinobacter sp. LN3S78]|uniref:glycosyltransferase family 4 protein n=1 Tax=Marinobacter sp. LN3S78 TaxID=3382300 RepID=UPI00387B4A98
MTHFDPGWAVLVPGNPEQFTGGYGYVRELVEGLIRLGQPVTLQGLPGLFPRVDQQARDALERALSRLPDNTTVIIDGLALGGYPEAAEQHRHRLHLVALVHHPLADETGLGEADRQHFLATERRALAAVHRVITTSDTTARGLGRFNVPASRVAVVRPGVRHPVKPSGDRAVTDGLHILCLAHLSPRKAQHHLVEALSRLPAAGWECGLAGSADRDRDYARTVMSMIREQGLSDRVRVTGELSGPELERAFDRANLFVLPSLFEGYGMVIDEALAHGLPVIASDGGALVDTANRPGCVTYPAGEVDALAALIHERLRHPEQLAQQQQAARQSARMLRTWGQAAREFLQAIAGSLPAGSDFDASWLVLREPADHAARSTNLTDQTVAWLRDRNAAVVADIGAGTGSNWRYLSRALEARSVGHCQWHLFEQDAALVDGIGVAGSGPEVHVQRLEVGNMDRLLPNPLDLLTASALIDLVSRPWLEALASAVARRRAAVLVVLSYAGRFRLVPEQKADEDLRKLINQHQHGDKGTGAACGPEASDCLAQALKALGYTVCREGSPWHLDGRHKELQKALMEGWAEAARAQLIASKEDSGWLDQWLADRFRQADDGNLVIAVDHIDLLGLPTP